jgi:predicted nucleotide-binding protein (sugar kinase/HSP70/actin superfamily)
MARLVYDKDGRLLFTREMKKEYMLLIPQMLPIHFSLLERCLKLHGYSCEALTSNHRGIVDTGLKYVHNDTCYPALLVIGQFIEALNSGKYDKNKVALLITQTGGGCRASNYIHLLRRALKKAGLEFVPVVSLNLSGLEKNPGFTLSVKMIRQFIYAIMYGDILMLLSNQCRPYEVHKGSTEALAKRWEERLIEEFRLPGKLSYREMVKNFERITADFSRIERKGEPKVRVGIVGEIYVKYSPLGNNNLEEFLLSEGAEPVVPGLIDFLIFKINNRYVDVDLYGGKKLKKAVVDIFQRYVEKCQRAMIEAVRKTPDFRAPNPFSSIKELAKDYLGPGNKMGEGCC